MTHLPEPANRLEPPTGMGMDGERLVAAERLLEAAKTWKRVRKHATDMKKLATEAE